MIQLQNVSKTFNTDNGTVHALDDVSLSIKKGDIFGIIGTSGAGKSTLIRCINLLERPDHGKIMIDGVDMIALNNKSLRSQRRKIGMIFQHFNLMASRTVFDNVALALDEKNKTLCHKKVHTLLTQVGIADKAMSYPSQLSGGQKQRVAIARALANDPDILLCDEATSALDPQTTETILHLLADINRKTGITIVLITHEMAVIKEICHHVAVMAHGKIVETNSVVNLFSKPESDIAQSLVSSTTNTEKLYTLLEHHPDVLSLSNDQRLVKIGFYGENTKEALISEISRRFDVEASIIHAHIEIIQTTILGSMVVIMHGSRTDDAITYLKSRDIMVEDLT